MDKYDFSEDTELTEEEQTQFTERKIFTDKTDSSIYELRRQSEAGLLQLQPDFQRHYVWDIKKASRLVESVLLGVPLPIVYLSEELDETISVIDGQQRLTSLFAFISGTFPNDNNLSFKLSGLNVLTELNGKTFKELTRSQQIKIENYSIRTVLFRKDSSPDLKFEIFERLNTGSVQLNPQELRNCIYRSSFNDLIKELSRYKEFTELMGFDQPKARMEDCEWVLRFCAFYYFSIENYKPSMKNFMHKMADEGRRLPEHKLNEIENAFKNACQVAKSIFAEHAFKRFDEGQWKNKVNASLYDIVMNSFARRNKRSLMLHADEIREALIDLMVSDNEFIDAIEKSTSSVKSVKLRFNKWNIRLDKILENDTKEPRAFSFALKQQMWEENPTCSLCQNRIHHIDDAALDHIKQYWCGGKTVPENARLTHRYCNNARSRKN